MQFCVLGELFTAGSPSGTIVSVGSLGRASMMLEDPKLVRIPRTSLTRRFCALFLFKCLTTISLKKSFPCPNLKYSKSAEKRPASL